MSDVERFASAIAAARGESSGRRLAIWDERASTGAIAAAGRLQEYRDHLARMRSFKASGSPGLPDGSRSVDRLARAATRMVLADADELCRSAASMVERRQAPGYDDSDLAAVLDGLQAAGPQSLKDIWAYAQPRAGALLSAAGFTPRMLEAMEEVIRVADLELSSSGSRLVVAGSFAGRLVKSELETAPRPARPQSPVDLLTRGQQDVVAEHVARGELGYLLGGAAGVGMRRIDDCWSLALVGTQREVVRHVRGLEDVGLAVHQGGEPTTLSIVVTVLFIILGLAIGWAQSKYCDPAVQHSTEEEVLCGLATLLMAVWLVIAILSVDQVPGPQPTTLSQPQRWVFKPLLATEHPS